MVNEELLSELRSDVVMLGGLYIKEATKRHRILEASCYPDACNPKCAPRCSPSCNPCYPRGKCNPQIFK